MQGLILKLLETTHSQWLYRNVQVHDVVTGALEAARKQELQQLIEHQIELGEASLVQANKYLSENILEDLETISRKTQTY